MRAFFAIGLGHVQEIGEFLHRFRHVKEVRWVSPHQVHLTCKFLGEISSHQGDLAKAKLGEVARLFAPFYLRWDRTGVFPRWDNPRVLWVGLAKEAREMVERIGQALDNEDIKPHVTMGRVKRPLPPGFIEEWRNIPINWPKVVVKELLLVKSTLTKEGPNYEIVCREELKGVNVHE